MAKKKISTNDKRGQAHEEWENLVVEYRVSKNPQLLWKVNRLKEFVDFLDFGMQKKTRLRHLRPPVKLFNKTLTYKYLEHIEESYKFASYKITKIW